ncbi:MAG TPA: TMEM175 family protein [Luteolibacter sp.]
METNRLEAFSDGVIAIILTIMVLEMKAPHGNDFSALRPVLPVFLNYALSFVYVGIYWNNHHHLLKAARRVTAGIMWANLHLLFWLSLFPFVTAWMGANQFAPVPSAFYGGVLLAAAVAYKLLQHLIIADQGPHSKLASAIGRDLKGVISPVCYGAAIVASFFEPWVAGLLYVGVALMWLTPDPRLEPVIKE